MAINLAKLDVQRIFAAVGGPTALLRLLDIWQPGHGLNYPRVHMWGARGVIPGGYIPAVFYTLEMAGYGDWKCYTGDAEELQMFGTMTPLATAPEPVGAPAPAGQV